MKPLQLAAIAGSALALSAGAAYAQYSSQPAPSTSAPAAGSYGANTSSMSSKGKMSDADMKRMQACKAMGHDAAMKDTGCVKMMKKHPDMMGSSGSTSTTPNP